MPLIQKYNLLTYKQLFFAKLGRFRGVFVVMTEADAYWDAGNMGCGELLIELKFKMAELKSGQVFRLVARDPGALEDMPSWCQMTGHRLLKAEHPEYWLKKN